MPLPWHYLIGIREEIPVRELGITLNLPLQDGQLAGESIVTREHWSLQHWYRIATDQFVRVTPDGTRFRECAWAASAAALARALTGDSLFDDQVAAQAPRELLVGAMTPSLAAIEKRAEMEDARRVHSWTDGRTKLISIDRYHFYFRLESAPGLESPIAIRVLPKVVYVGIAEHLSSPDGQ